MPKPLLIIFIVSMTLTFCMLVWSCFDYKKFQRKQNLTLKRGSGQKRLKKDGVCK